MFAHQNINSYFTIRMGSSCFLSCGNSLRISYNVGKPLTHMYARKPVENVPRHFHQNIVIHVVMMKLHISNNCMNCTLGKYSLKECLLQTNYKQEGQFTDKKNGQ